MPTLTLAQVAQAEIQLPKLLLTINEVMHVTGLSESAIYLKMKNRTFPRSLKGPGMRSLWKSAEIVAWIESLERYEPREPQKENRPVADQANGAKQKNRDKAAPVEAIHIVSEGAATVEGGV